MELKYLESRIRKRKQTGIRLDVHGLNALATVKQALKRRGLPDSNLHAIRYALIAIAMLIGGPIPEDALVGHTTDRPTAPAPFVRAS